MPNPFRCALAVLLALLTALPQLSAQSLLNIQIVEGEDAINNIRQRVAREPIVEVQDENHRPVAGAIVLFSAPSRGAGGVFPGGANTLSVTTDANGRAVAKGFQPGNAKGRYQIQVHATYAGLAADAVIHMRNASPGLSAGAKALIATAVIAAGVAATAVVVATRGGGNGGGGAGSTPTVITPGGPSVGPPH